MESQLSIRRLEVFRLIVEERSVTRAAEVLMIAQPAVSAQLRALEDWVGAKLFVRSGNRLILTEAGERTNAWAKELLAGAAQVRRDVGDLGSGVGGSIVVAASMGVGTYLLPPVLARLGSSRPRADITVTIGQPDEALHSVETGECDFAVLNWDQRELPDTISSEALRHERLLVCIPPSAIEPGRQLTLDEALALPFVGGPRNVVYQRSLVAQLRDISSVVPHFKIRLGHSEPMKRAAIEHKWALIFPYYVVSTEIESGDLQVLDVPGLDAYEQIVLVWRRGKFFSPLQQAAIDQIRSELGTQDIEGLPQQV